MGLAMNWLVGIGISISLVVAFSIDSGQENVAVTDVRNTESEAALLEEDDSAQDKAAEREEVAEVGQEVTEAVDTSRGRGAALSEAAVASATEIAAIETVPAVEAAYYPVLSVVDGDTVNILYDGAKDSVRLIGIDTPETVHPSKPVECFGREASNRAQELMSGEEIHLKFDDSQGRRDKYGRLLAYVFLEDGTHVNKTMIKEGYAYEYTYNVPYTYQDEFKTAEADARERKRGLWTGGVCEDEGEALKSPASEAASQPTDQELTPTTPVGANCHSSYSPCLRADASDYDCEDGSGNGPYYTGTVQVIGTDVFKLDSDGDGLGCE